MKNIKPRTKVNGRLRNRAHGFTLLEVTIVVIVVGCVMAIALPSMSQMMQNFRTLGDARNLQDVVMETKMHAASNFTHARAYFDLNAKTYRIDTWVSSSSCGAGSPPPSCWQAQFTNRTFNLSTGVSAGYGAVSSPPSNTQATIGQAPACNTLTTDGGTTTVSNTSCIEFNSRGIPIDSNNSPYGNDAFYITDGTNTYAITVSSTGQVLMFQTAAVSQASWKQR